MNAAYTRCDRVHAEVIQASRDFNPRTYTRCDKSVKSLPKFLFIFQSTHLYKVRQGTEKELNKYVEISIHAPIQGATRKNRQNQILLLMISIHAPIQGATWIDVHNAVKH